MSKSRTSTKILAVLLVLALVVAFVPSGAKASAGDSVSIESGDPVTINWTASDEGTVVNRDSTSSIIPAQFTLWVEGSSSTASIGNTPLTPVSTDQVKDENDIWSTVSNYIISTSTSTFDITVVVAGSSYNNNGTYTVHVPVQNLPSGGLYPADVNGYLPVGQFARPNSFGWGCIYANNTNDPTGTTPKFLSGYVSTGVSLGMAGGYVQFDMGANNSITNDADNPYGIDFIIYGNAFSTNPEAASVQVSNDGTTWYELAGSKYFTTSREHVDHLSYIKISADNTTISGKSFTKAGVYYSKDYVPNDSYNTNNDSSGANTAIGNATWYCIPTASTLSSPVLASATNAATVGTSYWPEQASNENYLNVWKMGTNGSKVGGVHWCRVGSAEVITYDNVNLVPDSDSPAYYQFGYADVHNNGNASNYGTAVNPYTVANDNSSANTGGDGFDLSWAVYPEGTIINSVDVSNQPVNLQSVKYVRVYSSVLFNTGVFGETSGEVCGLYVASGTTTQTKGEVNASLTLIATDDSTQAIPITLSHMGSIVENLNSLADSYGEENHKNYNRYKLTITPTNSSSIVFVNDTAYTGGFTTTASLPTTTTNYRVIIQAGTAEPYICFFSLS